MGKCQFGKKVVCPYYKGHQRQEIFCEGVQEGTRTHLGFADPASLEDYKRDLSESMCYMNCRIARMSTEKYD